MPRSIQNLEIFHSSFEDAHISFQNFSPANGFSIFIFTRLQGFNGLLNIAQADFVTFLPYKIRADMRLMHSYQKYALIWKLIVYFQLLTEKLAVYDF